MNILPVSFYSLFPSNFRKKKNKKYKNEKELALALFFQIISKHAFVICRYS